MPGAADTQSETQELTIEKIKIFLIFRVPDYNDTFFREHRENLCGLCG
jgi:hypothetical protein